MSSATKAPRAGSRASVLRSSAVMAFATIVSKLLGFVKNFMLTAVFGGSTALGAEAYYAANGLPDSIWLMIGGGALNAILVPAIVRASRFADKGEDYISRLMTLVMTLVTAVTALSMLVSPFLLTLVNGTDLGADTRSLALMMALWLLPQIMCSAMYVMCGQILNARDNFGPYTWAPAVNNVLTIAGATLFLVLFGSAAQMVRADWTFAKIAVICGFTLLGSVGQVTFLFYFIRKVGLHLRFRWGFRGLGFTQLGKIGAWSFLMVAAGQLAVYATRWSAAKGGEATSVARATSTLLDFAHGGTGEPLRLQGMFPGIASINLTYPVFMLGQSIIAVSIVTAIFPTMSRSAADHDIDAVRAQHTRTSRMLAVPLMLCTVVLTVLAPQIMWVAIGGSGRLEGEAVGLVLCAYMIGLVPFALNYLQRRVFYAFQDARSPFITQIPSTLVALIGAPITLVLVPPQWAAATAALFSTAGTVVSWLGGMILLRRWVGRSPLRSTIELYSKLTIAAALAGIAGLAVVYRLDDVLWFHRVTTVLVGAAVGALMVVIYYVVARLLRVEELTMVSDMLRRRLGRSRG